MYYAYTVKDSVSVPPKYIGEDVEKATTEILRIKYERTLDKDLGIVLVVHKVRDISDGYIHPQTRTYTMTLRSTYWRSSSTWTRSSRERSRSWQTSGSS